MISEECGALERARSVNTHLATCIYVVFRNLPSYAQFPQLQRFSL